MLLRDLGERGVFDYAIWGTAVEYLGHGATLAGFYRVLATHTFRLGDGFFRDHLPALTGLLERYRREIKGEAESSFWRIWDTLLELSIVAQPLLAESDLLAALNSPAGELAEALIIELSELSPSSYGVIPSDLQSRLERLLRASEPGGRSARVVLSKVLAWLHHLNPELAKSELVSRLDPVASDEAIGMWQGFLYSPRMTPDLWESIEPLFLSMFDFSNRLAESEENLYALLAWILFQEGLPLDPAKAREALRKGTDKGRARFVGYWAAQVYSDTEYGANLYRERLSFLISSVWPIDREFQVQATSNSFANLALRCGSEFTNAVESVRPFLIRTERPDSIVYHCRKDKLAARFPSATLGLVDALVGDDVRWARADLKEVLDQLSMAEPNLRLDPRFTRLESLARSIE